MMGGMAMRHRMGSMAGSPGAPEAHRAMMTYLWGRRWRPEPPDPGVPPSVRDRKYWEGTAFGVVVGARSFPGLIAVHADAEYVLNFRREIGVQRQVQELGRRAGVESVALLDPDLTVVAHSDPGRVGRQEHDPALQRLLGQGGAMTRFMPADGGAPVLEVARSLALEGGRPGLLQVRLSTAPMEAVWRRDRATAVVIALAVLGVGVLGLAAIFYTQHRQLTQVAALEAEVARRQRLATLGDMAAAVSHEVRNPLNAISMGLQRLRAEFRPTAEPADYDRVIELVGGEVRRLNTLVEEFLTLARPPVLNPAPLRLGDLIEEVAELIEPEARQMGVRVERRVPADLPPLVADHDRLTQVLLNLARNALEAMPDGGTLRLDAGRAPHALTIAVVDSGPGIPPEVRERIFEPYYTTKAKGLGLGLPIARQIVEAHGGTIAAAPATGSGTRFVLTLPLGQGRA
jgi:two-component system sensor histidine kinase HydH